MAEWLKRWTADPAAAHIYDGGELLGGQVVKALDCRPRGLRLQPHYSNRDFFSPRSLLCSAQNSEVYTASFGGDVKPSVPGGPGLNRLLPSPGPR